VFEEGKIPTCISYAAGTEDEIMISAKDEIEGNTRFISQVAC